MPGKLIQGLLVASARPPAPVVTGRVELGTLLPVVAAFSWVCGKYQVFTVEISLETETGSYQNNDK